MTDSSRPATPLRYRDIRAAPPAPASVPTHALPVATCLTALLLIASAIAPAAARESPRIVYPRSESHDDARPGYPLAVLRLALERSGERFALAPSASVMQQSRSLALLEAGHGVDIVWTVPTREREARLRPIRFPLDRGLIGWRVLLVRRDEAGRFGALQSLADLAALRGGQGHDWPDLGVLRHNGLKVDASPTYEGLFRMLVAKHVDYALLDGIAQLQGVEHVALQTAGMEPRERERAPLQERRQARA